MNSLLEALISQGYKAKAGRNQISIRFLWAAMPVLIVRNIQQNIYELKLQHWRYVIIIIAFLANVLIHINLSNTVAIALFGSVSFLYLVSAVLVYFKTRDLQKYVDSLNGAENT